MHHNNAILDHLRKIPGKHSAPRALVVSKSKYANGTLKFPGMLGSYLLESEFLHGYQHWKQEDGEYHISYEGSSSSNKLWKIENSGIEKSVSVYADAVGLPIGYLEWTYHDGEVEVDLEDFYISIDEDCVPDSDYCKGNLICTSPFHDVGTCYYPHLIRKKCCMKQ